MLAAALALGGLLPELLEEGAPRIDVDRSDASALPVSPRFVLLAPRTAVFLVGCHGRGLLRVTRPSRLTVAAPLATGHRIGWSCDGDRCRSVVSQTAGYCWRIRRSRTHA